MQNPYGFATLGFVIVAMASQYSPILPPLLPTLSISFATIVLIVLIRLLANKPLFLAFMVGVMLGLTWFASVGHSYAKWQLPNNKIQQVVTIQGRVLSSNYTQFSDKYTIAVSQLNDKDFQANIRVSWYRADRRFSKGQVVSLCVKLKPAHGLQNPYGFDYWRWLVSKKIVATGSVKTCAQNRLIQPSHGLSTRMKYRVESLGLPGEKWLLALMFADRQNFSKQDWQLLQQSGLAHLFALSGLHMGIVFLVCFWLARGLCFSVVWFFFLHKKPNLVPISLILAGIFSLFFVYLCAMPLTLVRAWIAVNLVSLVIAVGGNIATKHLFLLVILLSVLIFPFSIYGMSLYLTLAAVGFILLLLWRFPYPAKGWINKWRYWVKLQAILSMLMVGVSAFFFNQIYWLSPIFNFVAIPFVTLVIVPLCLLGVVLINIDTGLAESVLMPTGQLLMWCIDSISTLSLPHTAVNLSPITWAIIAFSVLVILIPPFNKKRVISFLSIFVVGLFSQFTYLNKASWTLTVFDVGQGTAMLLTAGNQGLLIDTGASFKNGFSMSEAVIAPYLDHASHLRQPLLGLLTHDDNDHAGGADYLMQSGYVNHWITPYNDCVAGATWNLGHLKIEALWPNKGEQDLSSNNGSCVIMVTDGRLSLLITGDIEERVEHKLLNSGLSLIADILIAPHHGSSTSSTDSFIRRVSPQYAVFTAGYLNRWGFPNAAVVERYVNKGVRTYNTAVDGLVRFSIDNEKINVETWQNDLQPRWYKSLSAF